MYETKTYESILRQMLGRIANDFDKREGAIIYDALAPAAAELAQMYIELDTVMTQTFADTASREYLIKRAKERGLEPYPASNAILKGVFNMDIPIGSRFSLEGMNYVVIEKISTGVFKMQCETHGQAGNRYFGNMIPIDYIQGLTSAELTEMLIPGEDEEDTEAFRKRYFNSLNAQAFGGNIADYKEKASAIQGVGGIKVYPVWNGGGTVKLEIISSTYEAPTNELINLVQTAIDPEENQGDGSGLAPIGHVVTVESVSEVTIDIQTRLTYEDGWTWNDIKTYIEQVIDEYFHELNKVWENETSLIVRISQIETRILALEGIRDISGTTINGVEANKILGANEIPKRGDVSERG